MNKIILTLTFLLFTFPVYSQQNCDLEKSVTHFDVLTKLSETCCLKNTEKKVRACINNRINGIKKTKGTVNSSWATSLIAKMKAYRDAQCDLPIEAESCANAVDSSDFQKKTRNACCNKEFRSDRRDCLKNRNRKVRKAKAAVGGQFINAVKAATKTLRKSDSCGKGGEVNKTGCDRFEGIRDGAKTGHLWKPVADHNPFPVFLLRAGTRSGNCKLINQQGGLVQNMTFSSIANGGREHHRPTITCGNLPRPTIVSCSISGQNVCFEVGSPCSRID